MPELAFLLPEGGADLAVALAEEVGRQDAAALVCSGSLPEPRRDRVYVVMDDGGQFEARCPEPSRTIAVLAAPPGTDRFARGVELARQVGAAFHVNSVATERLLEQGVAARHLQLGYSPSWRKGGPAAPRELAIAPANDPELLARAQLTIARDGGGYLDWPAVLRAIHCGAVVLHERALGLEPLVAGRHLFVAAADGLDVVAAALLRDPGQLERVRLEALTFIREALPLALAAAALIGAARTLVAQPLLAATDSTPGQPALRSK